VLTQPNSASVVVVSDVRVHMFSIGWPIALAAEGALARR
jgi:hypothetical protein